MSAITHIPFYPSDWLAGTRGMTAAEMGVYITLIAMMYERSGPIKADDTAKLARLCGTSASALKGILARLIEDGKIVETEDGIFNRRVELEIKNVMSKSEFARASVKARWAKKPTKSTPEPYERNTDVILTNNHIDNSEDKSSSLSDAGKPAPRKKPPQSKGSRLSADWTPSEGNLSDAGKIGFPAGQIAREAERFRDFWIGKPGQAGCKLDWDATWRNWIRTAQERSNERSGSNGARQGAKLGSGHKQPAGIFDTLDAVFGFTDQKVDVPGRKTGSFGDNRNQSPERHDARNGDRLPFLGSQINGTGPTAGYRGSALEIEADYSLTKQ